MVFTNKIIIGCPTDIASYWSSSSQISSLFDGDNLTLRIPQNKYAPVTQGTSVKQIKGAVKSVISPSTVFIGFRAQIDDSREDLKILIRELANYTLGDCKSNPINIIDYHFRRDRTDREQGYRIRTGIFTGEITDSKGTITEGQLACDGTETITGGYRGGGFSFRFMEYAPVKYFY